jgi:hypothetical protein
MGGTALMTTTSTDIVNEAIQLIGDNQPAVTGAAPTFDNSPAGKAAAQLYAPTVAAVARQFGWDFARSTYALQLSGNTAPWPWAYEYVYPPSAVQVWAIFSTSDDPNNPIPYNFNVANAVVNGVQQRVIQTTLQNAQARYNNNPTENSWDADFREAVVGLLASGLSMAIAGKPDLAQAMLQRGGSFETVGERRQD